MDSRHFASAYPLSTQRYITAASVGRGSFGSGNVTSRFVPIRRNGSVGWLGKDHYLCSDEEWEDNGLADNDYEEHPVFDDEPYEEEVVSGDVGVNLMIKRSCLTPKAVGDDWLKHNIFQSTCTVLGKGGSLRSVWENVVPMDACHLLLGRPWEYDRNTTHYGRANTYSFLFDGVKITLMPNKPKELVNKPTGNLLTLSQFQDDFARCGDDVFVLIGKEVAKDSEIPKAMIPLLKEFSDVFPDELPDGLPPLRDIQHHIDLEPAPLNVDELIIANEYGNFVRHSDFEERSNHYEDLLATESSARFGKKGIHHYDRTGPFKELCGNQKLIYGKKNTDNQANSNNRPPIFDDDQYEEESMPVYDTDIEDVIEEEEGFIEKGGFSGKEDNIEDVIVVANDICSSMIQTTLNVDFEEDINTKSHELVSFAKSIIIKLVSEPKFLIKMFPRKSEGEELEYPFFEGDGSSSDEWRDYGMGGDDYEGPPIFDDEQYEEELMPVYDTDIEDVIEEEEGFIEKGGFGGKEDNIEDVFVVANDLCSSMIQTTLNVDFEEDINTKSHELVSFAKSIIIKLVSEPKFLIKMFPRRSEGEELEYPFFEGDGSSSDEWRDYGMAGDDYEGPPIFDDDQYEEESMPVYDTDIEDVIEEEEGFIEKGGFGGKEDNIEDVVVVANDLCSSMIQTTLNVDFEEDINTKSHELMSFGKSIIIKVSRSSFKFLIWKKYWYLKVAPMVDKFGFKTIKVRGRVNYTSKGNFDAREIQFGCYEYMGTSEAKLEDELFFKWGRMMCFRNESHNIFLRLIIYKL
ncbi:putative reverse transcriptase domain-containing protein [Tanacetum coccineum]|uniref:Reverse transcriptase domain-containing protein n=1 Tax=Tanacetum coccineum TaxID=301880 RepID=A0ABQ4WG30_9ASTR